MKTLSSVFLSACLFGISCGDGTSTPPPKPKLPLPAWDWAGVIGTGQSLSVGVMGTPERRDPAPKNNNLKLSFGTLTVPPIPDPSSSELAMVPLIEPIRPLSTGTVEWPVNIFGETPHTAMADQITALYQAAGGLDYSRPTRWSANRASR